MRSQREQHSSDLVRGSVGIARRRNGRFRAILHWSGNGLRYERHDDLLHTVSDRFGDLYLCNIFIFLSIIRPLHSQRIDAALAVVLLM
jgi:hypothetical protein